MEVFCYNLKIKDKKLWLKAKMFDWGWYQVSWQGWVIILLYIIAVFKGTWNLPPQHSISDDLINIALHILPPTIFLLIICYTKGERPHWCWGK